LSDVKQRLWSKLHSVKEDVKKNIATQMNNLAQVVNKNHSKAKIKHHEHKYLSN